MQLLNLPAQMLSATVQLPSGVLPGSQYAILEGPNGAPSLVLLNSQMQLSLNSRQAQLILQQNAGNSSFRRPVQEIATKKEPSTHVPQLDGAASLDNRKAFSFNSGLSLIHFSPAFEKE